MAIKYRTGGFRVPIEKVEIEKESEKSIWIKNQRGQLDVCRKDTSWHKYFDSYSDAKNYLLSEKINRIKCIEDDLKDEKSQLEKIQQLHEEK